MRAGWPEMLMSPVRYSLLLFPADRTAPDLPAQLIGQGPVAVTAAAHLLTVGAHRLLRACLDDGTQRAGGVPAPHGNGVVAAEDAGDEGVPLPLPVLRLLHLPEIEVVVTGRARGGEPPGRDLSGQLAEGRSGEVVRPG